MRPQILLIGLAWICCVCDFSEHAFYLCRLTAWSPMRSLQSLSKFFFITGFATTSAWYSHPHLLNLAAHVLHLDFKACLALILACVCWSFIAHLTCIFVQDSVTAFQTSFFSFLSLVFAIYSGNTMAFLYDVSLVPHNNLR